MASTWLIATLLVYALGTIGKICQSNAMQRRPSGHYASIVVSRVRRPIPKRLANHEAQSIEEGGVKEGVDGDSRGLDEENKRREIRLIRG